MDTPLGFFPTIDAMDAATAAASGESFAPDTSTQGQSTTAINTLAPSDQILSTQTGIYVTSADTVVFTVWNSNANFTSIALTLRLMLPDGTIQNQQLTIPTLTSDRLPNQVTMPQTEGYLVSAMVDALAANTVRGQCFCAASIVRGASPSLISSFALFADYATSALQPQWPNGRLLSGVDGPGLVTVYASAPGVFGADVQINVPPLARWRVMAVTGVLATGPAVPTRTPLFLFGQFGNPSFEVLAQASQPASVTYKYSLAPGMPVIVASANVQGLPIPIDFYLSATGVIVTSTTNIAAADRWQVFQVQVEEWIDV